MRKQSGQDHTLRLGPLLKDYLGTRPEFSANPIGDWSELVGESVARYTRPRSLKKKVLVIAAHDSVWKHHLEQFKEVIADKINGKRKEKIVEEIVIRVADLPEEIPVLNPANKSLDKIKSKKTAVRKKPKSSARKLTPEEQQLLKSLPDPDLREIGARLLKRLPLDAE